MNEKKHILITGGAGFIGVNAVRYFAGLGHTVVIFDNFSRKGTEINAQHLLNDFPGVEIVRGDIVKDVAPLNREVARADVVIHLAAQVAVTTSVVDPRTDFEINALGTFNVLEALRASERKPLLINASTNKVFGGLEHHAVEDTGERYEFIEPELRAYGIPGNHPLDFHSPYGCSKGAADQYAIDYARIYGLKTVTFRQSCVYGTNQFGVEDQGWLAWFAIATMLDKGLTIYGNGKQIRDALYVDDLIALYAIAVERADEMNGRSYAVGGGPGNTLSLIELLRILETQLGKRPTLTYADIRPGDQPVFVADIRPLKEELGWSPQWNLERGIPSMIGWMKAHEPEIRTLFGSQ